jgi:paraquat-inducible protein B
VGLRVWLEGRAVGSLAEGSAVYYRDVEIGAVEAPELSEDSRSVRFPVRIDERYRELVRRNSRFWNRSGFRFEAGWRGVETQMGTVGTILSGGVVLSTPDNPAGEAAENSVFELHEKPRPEWLEWSPGIVLREIDDEERLPRVVALYPDRPSGLRVVLVSPELSSLSTGAPVHYRGRIVGEIGETRFTIDARAVEADAWIDERYATLVRANTRFWNASGIAVNAGITSGVKIRTQSIETIMAGGVSFATPDSPGAEVRDGARFALDEEPKKEWLKWAPAIAIP